MNNVIQHNVVITYNGVAVEKFAGFSFDLLSNIDFSQNIVVSVRATMSMCLSGMATRFSVIH